MAVTPKFRLNLPAYNETGWDDDNNENFSVIDAVLGQYAVITNIQGLWENSTAYTTTQRVVDSADSSVWACLVNHVSAAAGLMATDRASNPTYWESASVSIAEAADSAAAAAVSETAAAASATAAAASLTAINTNIGGLGVYRNAIVNGEMRIWQRGVGPIDAAVGTVRLADRWTSFMDGDDAGTTAVSQLEVLSASNALVLDAGLRYALNYICTVVEGAQAVRQLHTDIESVFTFAGRSVTLSFYAWCATGTVALTGLVAQRFGSGGSPSADVNTSLTGGFTVTTTPTRFTKTIALPSINGKTLGTTPNTDHVRVAFNLPIASTYNLAITGLQLELGSVANPVSYRPQGAELLLCQRYTQVIRAYHKGYSPNTADFGQSVNLPVIMRVNPTVTVTLDSSVNTDTEVATSDNTMVIYSGNITGTGEYTVDVYYLCSAEF